MSLLQMSIYGAVMILAVATARAFLIHLLPKRTFIVLWSIILIRLLVPYRIPSSLSLYSMIQYSTLAPETESDTIMQKEQSNTNAVLQDIVKNPLSDSTLPQQPVNYAEESSGQSGSGIRTQNLPWILIQNGGMILCAFFFLTAYIRCRRQFAMSLPVRNDYIDWWLKERYLSQTARTTKYRRPWKSFGQSVTVRMSDRLDTPLTYGFLKPVILLPKNTDWEEKHHLNYILWHEYTHICYGDALLKLVAVTALCIHWFNPLVWLLYSLLNRDIELACDETVILTCGLDDKTAYATMLIEIETARCKPMPVCSHFGQNAIEERIRAIMKIRKLSLIAVIFAAGLIFGIAASFATSAKEDKNVNTHTEFTKDEYDKLLALRFDGYEDMTVSDYQDRVWTMTDTPEYRDLLERFSQSESLYEQCDSNETADFLFHVLEPLTAESWKKRDFGGYASTSEPNPPQGTVLDMASLEYFITLTILNADTLTVREYMDTRTTMQYGMNDVLTGGWSVDELANEEFMKENIDALIAALKEELDTNRLQVDVEYYYQPLPLDPDLTSQWQEERKEQMDRLLKPYAPFGLTWEYDPKKDECFMYFEGRQVRGIMDEWQDIWITEHSGTGESIYAKNAIEVYAVYEDGQLSGLRAATPKEQEEWDQRRKKAMSEEGSWDGNLIDEEVREYLPGTKEDYLSILSLREPDYRQTTLADFNRALLDWGNENQDSYDRISCDWIWNDFRVSLSEQDRDFITRTVRFSTLENAMYVRSNYTKKAQEDPDLQGSLTKSPDGERGQYTFCELFYYFSYHVSDKNTVTVGERDRCVTGMLNDIQAFWDDTDIDKLLKMDKSDIINKLKELAIKNSSSNITITAGTQDEIGFECVDEYL